MRNPHSQYNLDINIVWPYMCGIHIYIYVGEHVVSSYWSYKDQPNQYAWTFLIKS